MYSFKPFRIENTQQLTPFSPIQSHYLGEINEKRCKQNIMGKREGVQQILERTAEKRQPVGFYKNKTYVRPGYKPIQKKTEPTVSTTVSSLTPSPKYLQMEQEIEEFVREEQEFDEWMNECFEQQQNTLLEDEYNFIHDTCVLLIQSWL